MDGKHFRYISGDFHYFRQHQDRWEDTIKKMLTGGLNAVQTYSAWNLHEPQKGVYNFEGLLDIERFLTLCKKYNLYVILRPGPYICSEFEFGAFPYWLIKEVGTDGFRKSNTVYLQYVDRWLTLLYQKVAPFMYHNGGPVILVQLENEYGFFKACDHEYMKHLRDLTKSKLGSDTVMFTTDSPNNDKLKCGSAEGVLATVDFGISADITGHFNLEQKFNGHGPHVNSEYWTGGGDVWGKAHGTSNEDDCIRDFDTMLRDGASVSQYMYEGGTAFAFMPGGQADSDTQYAPRGTSYERDAALSESGDMTRKWTRMRDVIKKYNADIPSYDVKNWTKKSYGKVTFTTGRSLWDAVEEIAGYHQTATNPLTFEGLGLDYGYLLYRGKSNGGSLSTGHVHDRAYVFVDKVRAGVVARAHETAVKVGDGELDILVENMGRLNYGDNFVEFKGLPEGVSIDGKKITGWEHFGFNFSRIGQVKWDTKVPFGQPGFFKGTFHVDQVGDTFLNPSGWTKGFAFVNGFNLGRYWTIGPQLTLYVPSPILKVGDNELIIFEAENTNTAEKTMSFDSVAQLHIKV
jgi:hypothetical protein